MLLDNQKFQNSMGSILNAQKPAMRTTEKQVIVIAFNKEFSKMFLGGFYDI
jgi:hypothetical protein